MKLIQKNESRDFADTQFTSVRNFLQIGFNDCVVSASILTVDDDFETTLTHQNHKEFKSPANKSKLKFLSKTTQS